VREAPGFSGREVEIYVELLNHGGSTARGAVAEALIDDATVASSQPVDVVARAAEGVPLLIPRSGADSARRDDEPVTRRSGRDMTYRPTTRNANARLLKAERLRSDRVVICATFVPPIKVCSPSACDTPSALPAAWAHFLTVSASSAARVGTPSTRTRARH
jgi:hypothetical protein